MKNPVSIRPLFNPPSSAVCTRFGLILLFVTALVTQPAQAQQLMLGPSVSLEDPVSAFSNPAVLAFQRPRVAMGARAYHVGIGQGGGVPLRQGMLLLSTPYFLMDDLGAGALVQYFDSPIYSRIHFGGSFSYRLSRRAALGVNLAGLNLSYNQDEFVGVDPNDPVFLAGTSKTLFTAGIGVYAQPTTQLTLAAGARNLNRPDLSLVGDGVREVIQPYLGLGYTLGAFKALFEYGYTPYGADFRVGVEAVASSGSFLRLSSTEAFGAGRIDGLLHIGGPLSIHYGYEIPLGSLAASSTGSHTFSVVFEFGRVPDLPEPVLLPPFVYDGGQAGITPGTEPSVFLTASDDYLKYIVQQIERSVDADVPAEALLSLSREDLGIMDSTLQGETFSAEESASTEPVSGEIALLGSYSPLYEASMREIGQALRGDSVRLVISGPSTQVMKAAGLRNHLVNQERAPEKQIDVHLPLRKASQPLRPGDTLNPSDTYLILEPAQTTLYIVGSTQSIRSTGWEVQVEDAEANPIRLFSGTGPLPDTLAWDWRDNNGNIIEPGVYRYQLRWQDEAGAFHLSNQRKVYVQKFLRKTTIEVTRDIGKLRESADEMEIKIQH